MCAFMVHSPMKGPTDDDENENENEERRGRGENTQKDMGANTPHTDTCAIKPSTTNRGCDSIRPIEGGVYVCVSHIGLPTPHGARFMRLMSVVYTINVTGRGGGYVETTARRRRLAMRRGNNYRGEMKQ